MAGAIRSDCGMLALADGRECYELHIPELLQKRNYRICPDRESRRSGFRHQLQIFLYELLFELSPVLHDKARVGQADNLFEPAMFVIQVRQVLVVFFAADADAPASVGTVG